MRIYRVEFYAENDLSGEEFCENETVVGDIDDVERAAENWAEQFDCTSHGFDIIDIERIQAH